VALLIFIIFIALIFEFTNGFHDAANVVATPVATKSLTCNQAIILAALFNFMGVFFGTAVAATISKGLVNTDVVSNMVLIAALMSAISWNFFVWTCGEPSSSSHGLIGSLAGAVIAAASYKDGDFSAVFQKVVMPMISSPIMAFFLALFICIFLVNICIRIKRVKITNKYLKEMQVVSTSLLAFSHGSNDAQKTMSIITLALVSYAVIHPDAPNFIADASPEHIPYWVITLCALFMGTGTLVGGKKIIKTLSAKLSKLEPVNGVAAELSSGVLVLSASHIGLPVSTTQVASGSIMGSGFANNGVNWQIVKKIATAWVLTIPACIIISYVFYIIIFSIFG